MNDHWIEAIAGSIFYSEEWYRARYPDVEASGLDPTPNLYSPPLNL